MTVAGGTSAAPAIIAAYAFTPGATWAECTAGYALTDAGPAARIGGCVDGTKPRFVVMYKERATCVAVDTEHLQGPGSTTDTMMRLFVSALVD